MGAPRIRIITLGCKVNQCDAEEMARALVSAGYEIAVRGAAADAFIVNTCTVTATADAKARKLIRKLARERPGAPVVVTGCWAQRDAQRVWQVEGVRAVVGNDGKAGVAEVVRRLVGTPAGRNQPVACSGKARTRVFVKVQDGCDHRCAYCAVPEARGAPMSKALADVLHELRGIAEAGAQEVVLCGIRLGAYGTERASAETLSDLLREARGIGIPRLRLSSIEPMDVTEALIAEMADHPGLCRHLHLPLQSGDDGVLAEMGRGYTSTEYARLVDRIRSAWPDVAVTTDVMVGFPGETDAEFERTVAFVRHIGFSRLHVFPFSPRAGTAAAEMPDRVPEETKRGRAERLIAVGEALAQDTALRCVGEDVQVLVEQEKGGRLTGLTEHYRRVWCVGPREWIGRIVTVRAERAERGELFCCAQRRIPGNQPSGERP